MGISLEKVIVEKAPLKAYGGYRALPSHGYIYIDEPLNLSDGFHILGELGKELRLHIMIRNGIPTYAHAIPLDDLWHLTYYTLILQGIPVTNPRSGFWERVRIPW